MTYLTTRRGDSTEDAAFFAKHPIYNNNVLDGLETLFQSYVNSEDPKKLSRIRIDDINAFHAFCVLCLRHTVGVMTWKMQHRRKAISEFFSVTDEALALVILENNAQVWKTMAQGNETASVVNKGGRYMKKAKDGSVRKEWSEAGKARFNDVCSQVHDLRLTSLSATNEKTLRGLWNQSSRRNQGRRETTTDDDERETNDTVQRVTFIYEG